MVDKVQNPRRTGAFVSCLDSSLRRAVLAVAGVVVLAALAACSSNSKPSTHRPSGSSGTAAPVTVRLGYFPNVTHAPAHRRRREGLLPAGARPEQARDGDLQRRSRGDRRAVRRLDRRQRSSVRIRPVNAFQKSNGEAIRIVAGSTSGGAGLVVKPEITTAADLKGKKIATPQLGNTQDVALRAYLKSQGLQRRHERRRRRLDHPAGQRRHAHAVRHRRHRRRVGARAVLHADAAGERRQGPRGREDAVAERAVRHHAPHRGDEVPRSAPRRRARPHQG